MSSSSLFVDTQQFFTNIFFQLWLMIEFCTVLQSTFCFNATQFKCMSLLGTAQFPKQSKQLHIRIYFYGQFTEFYLFLYF